MYVIGTEAGRRDEPLYFATNLYFSAAELFPRDRRKAETRPPPVPSASSRSIGSARVNVDG